MKTQIYKEQSIMINMEKEEAILMYQYPRPLMVDSKDFKPMYRLHKCSNPQCSILTEQLFDNLCFNCKSKLNGGQK